MSGCQGNENIGANGVEITGGNWIGSLCEEVSIQLVVDLVTAGFEIDRDGTDPLGVLDEFTTGRTGGFSHELDPPLTGSWHYSARERGRR